MPPFSRIFCEVPYAACRGTKDPYGDRIRSGHHSPTKHHHNTSRSVWRKKNGETQSRTSNKNMGNGNLKWWERMGNHVCFTVVFFVIFVDTHSLPTCQKNRLPKVQMVKGNKKQKETNMFSIWFKLVVEFTPSRFAQDGLLPWMEFFYPY